MEMLTWEKDRGGWISNGYRIVLVEPYHWVLLEDEPAPAPVRAEQVPLAEARTLTQCKREAELLDAATRVAELRRRSWGKLLLAVLAFGFVPTLTPPWDLALIVILLVTAARTAGFLAGTYLARSHLAAEDRFYQ
jgi:hypothetical protein